MNGLEHFGDDFLRLILHRERVLRSVDRVLGERFQLGPIGAGPGRRLAKVTAAGTYRPSTGSPLEDGHGYRVVVPVDVLFDLDLGVDQMRFHAEVEIPLVIRMELEDPLTILWLITPPTEEEVTIRVATDNRRSALVQRVAGIDGELRRFIVRFIARELEKPHVRRATRIELMPLIDAAWPVIAAQFLPNGPEDRGQPGPPGEPGPEAGADVAEPAAQASAAPRSGSAPGK